MVAPKASYPTALLEVPVVSASPAEAPMRVLCVPVFTFLPAFEPTAVLYPSAPAFKFFKVLHPIAVLLPCASSCANAAYPKAVLLSPVVIAVPASSPTTTL